MPISLNIEDSYIYQQGFIKGALNERKKLNAELEKIIAEMLEEGLPENKIARFLSLPLEKVQKIKQELKAENKIK